MLELLFFLHIEDIEAVGIGIDYEYCFNIKKFGIKIIFQKVKLSQYF